MAKRKECMIAIILVLAVAIPIGFYVTGNLYYTAERIYEQNWDIELPDKMKEKLDVKDGISSHNDGVRYTIFKVKERSKFLDDFISEKSSTFEEDFQENLSTLKLLDENYPDWNHNYMWKQIERYGDFLDIVFDEDSNILFIMQRTQ